MPGTQNCQRRLAPVLITIDMGSNCLHLKYSKVVSLSLSLSLSLSPLSLSLFLSLFVSN